MGIESILIVDDSKIVTDQLQILLRAEDNRWTVDTVHSEAGLKEKMASSSNWHYDAYVVAGLNGRWLNIVEAIQKKDTKISGIIVFSTTFDSSSLHIYKKNCPGIDFCPKSEIGSLVAALKAY